MVRGLAAAAAVVLLLSFAAPAHAVTTNCDDLQSTLDAAAPGSTVTLTEDCEADGAPFTLPSRAITLEGSPGVRLTGDGTTRILQGNDIGRTTIRNLVFRGGRAMGAGEDGGAILITGHSGLFLTGTAFFDNQAADRGGAVHVETTATPPDGENNLGVGMLDNVFGAPDAPDATNRNSAAIGGAVSAVSGGVNDSFSLTDNTFQNNTAVENGGGFGFSVFASGSVNVNLDGNEVLGNTAGGSGGGGHVVAGSSIVHVTTSRYEGNKLVSSASAPAGDHLGAGLYLENGIIDIHHTIFRSNQVGPFLDGDLGGGGVAVRGADLNVRSEFNRIESNTVAAPDDGFESEGGGIWFSSAGGHWYGFLDAIAGNSVGAGGEGGGIYTGAAAQPTTLELGEVTIAHNTVGTGGAGAGVAGGGADELIARNSVIWNEPNLTGFASMDVTYSLVCAPGGGPVPGVGNICADPKLVGGTDVHQTKASPTIDAGNDAYFADEGGGERNPEDYEGDPRPTDGDGDGHTIDMGADETPAGFTAPPPPPPPPGPPQCSDGSDNDGDGAVDLADPGCLAGPADDNEGDETERDLVLCGERTISLVRADLRGNRVVLSGIVAESVAGQRVRLSVRYLGRRGKAEQLGSVTPGADGKFQARVKKPARRLLSAARYRATVGSARSVELKLPQSLASTSLRQVAGGMLELRGQVQRSLLGKRNAVVVKRILCGRYATVGQARPNPRGVYVVRFPAPASSSGGAALYRAETRVLARPGSRRYVKQFARAIGITF